MDSKISDWRPGPTVCRCCLSEGCYKDISTEYFWMGKTEVYADMLSETFNLSISYSQSGGPNSNSRLICEPCISRLRDASEFKRQVQECEKTFINHLDSGAVGEPSTASMEIEAPTLDVVKGVKLEEVKLEKQYSDDEFDCRDFGDEDDDDDLDDQPLTTFATKVPKKESVDLLDLLDNTQITVKRKSKTKDPEQSKKPKLVRKATATVKAKASVSAKKVEVKPVEKKKKERSPMYFAKLNAQTIVQYTTAYPFRLPESSMVCVYCCENYVDPAKFREHMDLDHKEFKLNVAFAHVKETFIKVDCTDLRCRMCNNSFDNIQEAAEHIDRVHEKYVNFNYELGLQPFKIKTDLFVCAICDYKALNLCALSRHMQIHYSQSTCHSCGKSYATPSALQNHINNGCRMSKKRLRCRKCKRNFETRDEMRKHLEESKMCCVHVCNVCSDRFGCWRLKQSHMEKVHGIATKDHPCPECEMVFIKHHTLRTHFRIAHTNYHWICANCGRKFATEYSMNRHKIIHTGEKSFVCSVCDKAFNRKSNLAQHMWIHSEVKRHECKICDKKFNQRVSWKTHMKSRHPEICDF